MNVSENFKSLHNSGVIILVVDNKEIRHYKYSGVITRQKKMNEWGAEIRRLSFGIDGYIKLIPDWDKWNGVMDVVKKEKKKTKGSIYVGGNTGRKIPRRKPEYSPSNTKYATI